jgi:hypothetical protein
MQASDAELIDEFIDALWLADGLSKNTLASYRSDLALFSDWLAGRHATIVGADETAINGYLAFLHARPGGIKSASQRRLMASCAAATAGCSTRAGCRPIRCSTSTNRRRPSASPRPCRKSRSKTCSARPT